MSIFDRRRIISTLFLLILSLSTPSCGLSDLRPDGFAPSDKATLQGHQKLQALAKAHGGLETWRAHKTARIKLTDTWPSWLMRTFGMAWDESPTHLEQDLLLGQDASRLRSPNQTVGMEEGIVQWGIQHWATYTVSTQGEVRFKSHEDAWFWLPTLEYFFEAPFRLHEAQHALLLPPVTRGGRPYDRVYLTWGQWGPQDDTDQYVAWINQSTGHLDYLEFTARDVYGFVDGLAIYKGWHDVQGIQVPQTIIVTQGAQDLDEVLHTMEFDSIVFGLSYPKDYFTPKPGLKTTKSARGKL